MQETPTRGYTIDVTETDEPRYEVSAYRCDGCGLLKLYASDPASSPGNIYG